VIQEETRDVAEILSVDLLLLCIEFKHRDALVSVYLISRWTAHLAPLRMLLELCLPVVEGEAEWASVKYFAMVLLRQWRVVPRLNRRVADLQELNRFESSAFQKVIDVKLTGTVMHVVVQELLLLLFLHLSGLLVLVEGFVDQFLVRVDHILGDPSVVASFNLDVVHVVLVLPSRCIVVRLKYFKVNQML
jgi:hypothetical protein